MNYHILPPKKCKFSLKYGMYNILLCASFYHFPITVSKIESGAHI